MVARWILWMRATRARETVNTYQGYWANHLLPWFDSIDEITAERAAEYVAARLAHVRRSTVCKELAALRGFVAWLAEKQILDDPPIIKDPPKRTIGTAYKNGARDKVLVRLTEDQALAIIAALPERSPRAKYPIRALFQTVWDTSFRPATLWRLTVPQNYRRGALEFVITRETDKARHDRRIPISAELAATLAEFCPDDGLLFPRFEFRRELYKAALAVLGDEHLARHVSPYDFRHGTLTHLGTMSGDLSAIGHIAGHKSAATTARYIHTSEARAAALLKKRRNGSHD